MEKGMSGINPVIHQPVRLRIMATLVSLDHGEKINFVELRNLLGATDGNLGAHLRKLEEKGYATIEKTFVMRKPCTYAKATNKGRGAFEAHIAALKEILDQAQGA